MTLLHTSAGWLMLNVPLLLFTCSHQEPQVVNKEVTIVMMWEILLFLTLRTWIVKLKVSQS